MKKIIAFIYNLRRLYPNPDDPKSHLEADYDDQITIKWMIKHLKNLNLNVLPIESNERAYYKILQNKKKIFLAFNYSMGVAGKDGYAQIPAILEALRIPYTGSSPLTQAIIMNKAKTKEILIANNIPTLPYQIFSDINQEFENKINYPLIVKPIARGSSAGITNKSVVKNDDELKSRINFIIKTFNEPALVEPFLTGREFSISMLGNPPRILPIIESNHKKLPKGFLPLDSLEVKWYFEEQTNDSNLVCPAKIEKKLENKIKEICLATWKALGIYDFCRIDLRCDSQGNPYVLEVNSPPGLIPPEVSLTSYFPLSARASNIDYESLLRLILQSASKRYHRYL